MNVSINFLKTRLPLPILTGMGMVILFYGLAPAAQSHEQVKADLAKATHITIEQAIQTATMHVPGTVIKAELEKEHGPLMWEIEIVTSEGNVMEVHLDGESGKRLALQSGAGSQEDSDSAIHAGSAKPENQKMKEQASEKSKADEPSKVKNP